MFGGGAIAGKSITDWQKLLAKQQTIKPAKKKKTTSPKQAASPLRIPY